MQTSVCLATLGAVLLAAGGCKVSKQGSGEDKRVSIQMPGASIHVDKGPSVALVDLPFYPGATAEAANGDESSRKHVEIAAPFGSLKVVKAGYATADAPAKVLAFYRQKLESYGKVLECKGGASVTIGFDSSDYKVHGGGDPVYCSGSSRGEEGITLKVGTQDNARMVRVRPKGAGSEFTLITVRTSDEGSEAEPAGRHPS